MLFLNEKGIDDNKKKINFFFVVEMWEDPSGKMAGREMGGVIFLLVDRR